MKLDVYAPCPGGLNKKIKFCCMDLGHVLETVFQQLDGDQAHSALDTIDRQLALTPDRPCLLSLRIEALESAGGESSADEVQRAVDQFREQFPENPIALAYSAVARLNDMPPFPEAVPFDDAGRAAYTKFIQDRHEICVEAIDQLQSALAACESNIPYPLFSSFGGISAGLLKNRMYLAIFQHLLVQARLKAEDDPSYLNVINSYLSEPAISPFLKTEFRFRNLEEDTPWRDEYNEAARLGNRCRWRSALAAFEQLHNRVGDHPILLRAIYMASASLGLDARAVDALHRMANLADDPLQALETEATALELELNSGKYVDYLVQYELTVDDANATLERLQSDPRIHSVPVNPAADNEGVGPPPKATFLLADGPVRPAEPIGKLADLPRIENSLALYGKETDRPARLQWLARDSFQRESTLELLREILGDLWHEPEAKLVGYRLDADCPPPSRRILDAASTELRSQPDLREQLDADRMQQWLNRPCTILFDKTPREAAADPELRRRLQALVLIQEMRTHEEVSPETAEQVRSELGLDPLPAQLTIDPKTDDLPLWRLSRIEVANAKTEDLVALLGLVMRCQLASAQNRIGEELLRRIEQGEDIAIPVDRIHYMLAASAIDYARKIEHLQHAQTATVKHGKSPAEYLLTELIVHLNSRGADVNRMQRVMELLTTRHNSEPGILDKLRQILTEFGLLGADGRVRIPRPTTTTTVVGAPTAEPVPATPTPPPPPPPSKLWLPGQD